MRFDKFISYLAENLNKSSEDGEIKKKIKSSANFSKNEVSKSYLWKELERKSEFILVPQYTAGTVTTTQDSRTVSGTSTAWTSDFVGRYFQAKSGGNTYRILSVDVSAQTLILEVPIIEDSASSQEYIITKRYYRVNDDIRLVLPDQDTVDLENPFEIRGYDLNHSPYTTGTVTTALDSNALTGIGTSWLENIFPGQTITIGNDIYYVKSVLSDTSIKMTNKAVTAVTSADYSIESETPYVADIWTASTEKSIKRFSYLRLLYPMVNDSDSTELSNKFDLCLLDFGVADFKRKTNSPGWKDDLLVAQARLEKLKLDSSLVWYSKAQFSPNIRPVMGREISRMTINR